ncbi:MAG: chloride channel protein [Acidimicrobiia bacterium]
MPPEHPEHHPTGPVAATIVERWRVVVVEQGELVVHLLRWIVLGAVSGVLAGVSSYVFLEGLDRMTEFRLDHEWLLWLLPAAGLVIGAANHYIGGRAVQGNALLIDQIHEPTTWVPRRMAPLVLAGTWITHLFGGSAGREGTALQMSGSLTDLFARTIRLDTDDRRLLLVTALGGGFGAVFGVPLAGAVFALEVQSIGRVRYEALVPALTAALIGDLVVHGLGHGHRARPQLDIPLDGVLLAKVAVAGLAFGLAGAVFAELTHAIKAFMTRSIRWLPLRPVIGGTAVVGLAALFGRDYLGLSLPLIDQSLAGDRLSFAVFALKIVFTAVTLGCGFPGGEVTPLFVIGATLGAALATPLHLDVTLLAAVGFVAVFAGAANTPLACTIMGVELFGAGAVLPLAVGCVIAYVFSSHRGIYPTQRIHAAKGPRRINGRPTLHAWGTRLPVEATHPER